MNRSDYIDGKKPERPTIKGKDIIEMIEWEFLGVAGGLVLSGFIEDHPRLGRKEDGERRHVSTSLILRLDMEKKEVETLNTIYKLVGE